ncbi:MAG: diguanylate cyclase [Treponema sp.]|jgi:diguanylate cyclase (GGDEF)-like protein|nr:diguanylate cyclase [Treponema sp.]
MFLYVSGTLSSGRTDRQMPVLKAETSSILRTEIFSSLLEKEREYISSRSGIIHLEKGENLFSSGEKADRFYKLVDGSIRVFKLRDDGIEDDLAWFDPGDTIGDFDFARGAMYDATSEAVRNSTVVVFPAPGITMEMIARENPQVLSQILLNSIVMITSRIKSTQKTIVENISLVQELYRKAYEDSGTGLYKQSFLTDEINRLLEEPTALIMIKPDNFKILVDSRGHSAGDEAMVRIAMLLKLIVRRLGRGYALRFKSNEVGLLFTKCPPEAARQIAEEVHSCLANFEPVPPDGDIPEFRFSGTVSFSVWPNDGSTWDSLFQGNYDSLLDHWRSGGNCVVHYNQGEKA